MDERERIVICGTAFRREDILALLRRDAEFLHKDISDEELFALALREVSWPPPENYREIGAADFRAFWSDFFVPLYIPAAVRRSMAAGK